MRLVNHIQTIAFSSNANTVEKKDGLDTIVSVKIGGVKPVFSKPITLTETNEGVKTMLGKVVEVLSGVTP